MSGYAKSEESLVSLAHWVDERNNQMEEIEIAMRDLDDEWADGLINPEAYLIRRLELKALLKKAEG